MKKVLVTGAAGTIGMQVIKYLLSEGKYEIAALDLKNNHSKERLKKYRKRINIIYGDACDRVLIEALVKDFDVVIHLAGVMPPLADYKKGLCEEIDYKSTFNIVRAINYYNSNCYLIYPSTTLVYKNKKEASVDTKIKLNSYDYYAQTKKKCEDLIQKKLKNYTIYRIPMVLSLMNESIVLNGKKDDLVDWICKEDVAYILVKSIDTQEKINKEIFNLGSPKPIYYYELLHNLLKNNGWSWKYLWHRGFLSKITYPVCTDKEKISKYIEYEPRTIDEYYASLRKNKSFMKSKAKVRK